MNIQRGSRFTQLAWALSACHFEGAANAAKREKKGRYESPHNTPPQPSVGVPRAVYPPCTSKRRFDGFWRFLAFRGISKLRPINDDTGFESRPLRQNIPHHLS